MSTDDYCADDYYDDEPLSPGLSYRGPDNAGGECCECGYTLTWPSDTTDEDKATMLRLWAEHQAECAEGGATELNLTPAEWEALTARLAALDAMPTLTPSQHSERTALREVLTRRPQPVLPDGIYEVTWLAHHDRYVAYVKDGHWAHTRTPAGNLGVQHDLPDDTSGWRRIHEVPDPADEDALHDLWMALYTERGVNLVRATLSAILRHLRGESR